MDLRLGTVDQIALTVTDVDAAIAFYGDKLGLRQVMRPHPGMVFFALGGISLLLEKAHEPGAIGGSCVYFNVADIALTVRELESRGVTLKHPVHLITKQPAYDLYMAFFPDLDGNMLALSMRAPKGYVP